MQDRDELAEIRRRQRSRSVATALLLGALVILFFGIAIVKIVTGR